MKSAEQQARDMLERAGVEDAQSMTAGDLVEIANLIADRHRIAKQAGEVMRERCSDSIANTRSTLAAYETIRALPGVTLADLKGSES